MEQGGTWTFAITRRGRRHIEIWIGTSVVPGQSLWCKKESIGRGSPQVSLGNITADTATNCGVTHNIYIYMYIYIYILYTFFPWIKLRFSGSSCSVNSSYALPGFFFSGAQASKSSRLAPLCNMPAEYPSCLSVVRVTIGGE